MMISSALQSGSGLVSSGPYCRKRKPSRGRLIAELLLISLAAYGVFLFAPSDASAFEEMSKPSVSAAPDVAQETSRHPRENTYFKRKWGIEIMYVEQTAAGHMLEFRYRVLDPEKAKPLFERRTKPVLIDAETGTKLTVPTPPTTGALRNSNPPLAGQVYWMFFSNPGKVIKPGRRVTIEIGEFRVKDLVVR